MDLTALISGGALGALISALSSFLIYRLRRRDGLALRVERKKEEDRNKSENRLLAIELKVDALTEGMRYVLFDRIRLLAQKYIKAGEVDIDDRRMLGKMHRSYHSGLSGNGDLDLLMREVNSLPLKKKSEL